MADIFQCIPLAQCVKCLCDFDTVAELLVWEKHEYMGRSAGTCWVSHANTVNSFPSLADEL